ncbi:MAG: serine hydrolase [Pseudanabaenaceae cyanobacterium]
MRKLRQRRSRAQKRPMPLWLRLARLGIVIIVPLVALSLIIGTVSALFRRPAPPPPVVQAPAEPSFPPLPLKQEITTLTRAIQGLVPKGEADKLTLYVMLYEPDQGSYVDINANTAAAAASLIKMPILVAFLEQVDQQTIALDEMLQLTEDVKAPEAGILQDRPVGTKVPALEVATLMITESDNTATNMMIKRLGDIEKINEQFSKWGMQQTRLRNKLPDLQGTNTTTAKELVELFSKVEQNQLLSLRSRDLFMDILSRTKNNTLLAAPLGEGVRIRHKTGTIASLVGDTAMIDTPNGKRYFLTVMVKRPPEDGTAEELIRNISTIVYDYFQAGKAPLPPTSLTTEVLN